MRKGCFLVSRCQMNCVRSGLSNIWTPDRDLMDINLVKAELVFVSISLCLVMSFLII